ncbi:MAG: four helix bundle protein [Phycisphaerae bacterium]
MTFSREENIASHCGSRVSHRPPFDITARAGIFADRCIQVALALPGNGVAWELQKQFVRSSASIGANLAERKGVISKSEFSYKLSVSLREAHETLYWLDRIVNAGMMSSDLVEDLIGEGDELVSILTAMLKQSRNQDRNE